jgi:hypothetical protein
MSDIDPKRLEMLSSSARWRTLVKLDEPLSAIAGWDRTLLRKPRVLVPIDVQALYVPQGGRETFVPMPFTTTTPDGAEPEDMPEPFAPGRPRPAGVHLHWAMPDALLSGTLTAQAAGSTNRLALPALPDRWVVLRLLVPNGSARAKVTGWVIEADTTRLTPLADWPDPGKAAAPTGKTIAPEALTGTAGGAVTWSAGYDAVANRFAFHDPLSDVSGLAPNGVNGDLASYVVCGWWSAPERDPLDVAFTEHGLRHRLEALKWRLVEDVEDKGRDARDRLVKEQRQAANGLASAARFKGGIREAAVSIGREGLFAGAASQLAAAVVLEPYSSLLHGVIHGVPVTGPVVADQRPRSEDVSVAVGFHNDDLAAQFAADGEALSSADRRAVERLVSGFTHDLLAGMGDPNGLFRIEQDEHGSGFSSRPGEPGPVERIVEPGAAADLPGTGAQRSARRGIRSAEEIRSIKTELTWSKLRQPKVAGHSVEHFRRLREIRDDDRPKGSGGAAPAAVRSIRRPTPRYFEPMEPMLAVRDANRSLRHGHDRRRSPDSRLPCRLPAQVATEIEGVIGGGELTEDFPRGAIPPEIARLVHNAMILDPYLAPWRAQVAARSKGLPTGPVRNRMFAETALRFAADGRVASFGAALRKEVASSYADAVVAAGAGRFSLIGGVDSDPIGVTAWAQPWVPLWLEWSVELDLGDRLEGWNLTTIDLEPQSDEGALTKRRISGRSPLHGGVAATLANAITGWLVEEEQRDDNVMGEVDEIVEEQLATVARAVRGIDILAAGLDSLHDVLLGLPVGPYGVLSPRDGAEIRRPAPTALPHLLAQGRLKVDAARLVDAFGRVLDLPVEKITYPARDESGQGMLLRPRLLRPARWLFRFVDPADPGPDPREATIDQAEPASMVNPVAGFLLPDHIDEALEAFDAAGRPLGQLFHDPIGGGVTWEIAPGRPGPPDAGPLHDLAPEAGAMGALAAALIASDAAVRGGRPLAPGAESALSALLRAIDTTLWTVDSYAGLGSAHIAGLVGRPIAVVQATLRLDIRDDRAELDLTAPGAKAERRAAYAALADRAFPVRIGEITRDDDGLLAFFVDGDFSRCHVVDKVVRDSALDTGRGRGQLGLLGTTPQVPDEVPILHPYVVAEDQLLVRPGQTVRLTLLMHPGGKCNLTSGILPRKSLQLARDWIAPGLAAIAPSARIGPVLIDTDKVRLPLIASFGADQLWTRRDGNYAWKDDPILAATQTALLPHAPATVEEGYIRIAPLPGDGK